jgi:hypothetical protein
MQGLINGIDSQIPALRRTLADVTGTVAGVQPALDAGLTLDASGALAATSSGRGAAPVQIVVNGALDPNAVARQIVQLLVDLARRLGIPVAQLFARGAV